MTNRDFLVRLVGKELIYNGPKDLKNYVLIGNISFDDSDEVINYIMNKYKNLIKLNYYSKISYFCFKRRTMPLTSN